MSNTVIAAIPVPLQPNGEAMEHFEIDIVAPGTIRALALVPQARAIQSSINGGDFHEIPVMFVECLLDAPKVRRTFVLSATYERARTGDGYRAAWRATGVSSRTPRAMHLWELELDVAGLAAKVRNPLFGAAKGEGEGTAS